MKTLTGIVSTSAVAVLLLSGCASNSFADKKLDSISQRLDQAKANAEVEKYAPVAVEEAEEQIKKLEKMAERGANDKKMEQQVYIASRKVDIAESIAAKNKAEETIASAENKRKDILLEATRRDRNMAEAKASVYALQAHRAEDKLDDMKQEMKTLKSELKNVSTKETERGMVLVLNNILFAHNDSDIKKGSERTLEKVADFLKGYPEKQIIIEGFTDSSGSADYNLQLSKERAMAVKSVLTEEGLKANRLETEGYGEKYPIASNDTKAGRQQNRRVEILIANSDEPTRLSAK